MNKLQKVIKESVESLEYCDDNGCEYYEWVLLNEGDLIKSHLLKSQHNLLTALEEEIEGMDKIPCDCPKGGLVGENELPCQKCDGSEWRLSNNLQDLLTTLREARK